MATPLSDERTPLTLVKDVPETADLFVVEKRPRPAWMLSGTELRRRLVYIRDNGIDFAIHHSMHSLHYLGWSIRGYRRLCLLWWKAHEDNYRQQIKSAKQMLRAAKGKPADEAKFKALVDVRRAEYKQHKKVHWIKTGISGLIFFAGTTVAVAVGSWWVQLLLALAFIITGAYFGRPDGPTVAPVQAPTRTSHLGEETMRRILVEAGVVPEKRAAEIRGVGLPHTEGPGIAYAVDLPSGMPAVLALGKKKEIASALAVHSDWLDLSVGRGAGSSESRLEIWVSREDPFASAHASPLIGHKGKLDLWNDGAPLAFGKRGNTVLVRVRDTMMLVGGATRRGKGVFLANLNLGAAKDVRLNLRLFDGKASGEHNAFSGLLATFVKKNPERLTLFLRAVLEDLDRRADFLDERGKAKLTEDLIEAIGGIELIDIDELATYTAKGTSPYVDEIVESLAQIGAVGAGLGVLLVAATQVPEVDVVRGRLRQNLISRAAMNTESPNASNTILGDGMAGQGYDASVIPLDQPGRFWFKSPDLGTVSLRSFFIDDDDKAPIIADAYEMRKAAGRLPGQWHDPIEAKLTAWTGISSAAGGPKGNGRIVREVKPTLLDHLVDAVGSTRRAEATRAEVFAYLATVDEQYERRAAESDAQYSARVGKILAAAMTAEGLDVKAVKVATAEGRESRGFRLDDLTSAR
ncbi:hypothetical protein [Streptomyces sp. NPDC050564]|uniref:hypothetical protein n=1 Tax=Streptomyces sp. NPDC050564 TaxID=3365631 RepID=UPI0037BDD2DD